MEQSKYVIIHALTEAFENEYEIDEKIWTILYLVIK